jgi:hypothetical protein
MRVGTLANPYFLNLYIPTNFFFFKFEGGHWSHAASAPGGGVGGWLGEEN